MAAIYAKKGNVFVRKADEFVMGNGIDLGVNDSIDNYIERECTEEEMNRFYPVPKKVNHTHPDIKDRMRFLMKLK